ncbi:MAG TPA: DoxX family protein [Blastocatellia bacterium]|nr:DoxX family protein [Blastocatellia bacterium]
MTTENKAKLTYWAVTLPIVATIMLAGIFLLAGVSANVEGITHLGYPAYLCKILGVAKFAGGLAIFYGRYKTLKEWAYAGYTFNLLGASASHVFSGDGVIKILIPIINLGFVLVSYWLWKTREETEKNNVAMSGFGFAVRHVE